MKDCTLFEKVRVRVRVRLSKIEVRCGSACGSIIEVRVCVRHTAKYLATQRCTRPFFSCSRSEQFRKQTTIFPLHKYEYFFICEWPFLKTTGWDSLPSYFVWRLQCNYLRWISKTLPHSNWFVFIWLMDVSRRITLQNMDQLIDNASSKTLN